jgi:hypothetical protein
MKTTDRSARTPDSSRRGPVPCTIAALALAMGAGCAAQDVQPAKSPLDRASFMESTRCIPGEDEKELEPVLSGKAVTGAEPLYSTSSSGKSGRESLLRGVRLSVIAFSNVTPEWLDRALECHGAKATLGSIPATVDDPFFLPNSTVDIDVNPAKDGFEVVITAFSVSDAKEVLNRANAFVQRKTAAKS